MSLVAAAANAGVQLGNIFNGADTPVTPYYRCPALVTAPNGDLLAFIEARPLPNDPGEVTDKLNSIACRRSTDGGATWGPLITIANGPQANFNYSDPRTVVDVNGSTGKVVIMYAQWPNGVGGGQVPPGTGDESSVILYRTSSDNGLTWNPPVNINTQVKDPSWRQLDTAPGLGIQLKWQTDPARNGRVVMPGWVLKTDSPTITRDASLYSDDHGATWHHSPATEIHGNENQVVELTNGNLLMEGRPDEGLTYRKRWISTDGGENWTPDSLRSNGAGDIPVTTVNCGLLRYSAKRDGGDRDRILFSGPLGEPTLSGRGMRNLAIWTSYDEGKTFINPVQITGGFCCYSAMEKLHDGSIVTAYESGPQYPQISRIALAKYNVTDLEGPNISRHVTHYDGFGNNIDRMRGGVGWSGSWTGTAIAANDYRTEFNGKGLSFAGSPSPAEDGRMDLTPNHNTAERRLATPVDLNTNSKTYVALMVSRALDGGPLSGKPLDIQLRDSNEVSRAAFGVNNSGQFYINTLDNSTLTTAALDGRAMYLVVLKIVSQDAGQAGNFDQLYLKAFRSGADAIPDTDANLDWTLVGSTGVNSSAVLDRISLAAGSTASWSFDEVRIGESFAAAVSNVHAPEPRSAAMLLSAAAALYVLRACRK